jgi:tagatose 6-phosphate kinase
MILVVGLSPAWQRSLELDRVELGGVNRARRVTESAAGKGVNVARMARQLGEKVRLLTVIGGPRGGCVARSLREDGIAAHLVRVAGETRLCQTLLVDGHATELVEETRPLRRAEVGRVLSHFADAVPKASLVVLTGSVPAGCGDGFYARLAREANRRGVRVLADAQGKQLLHLVRQKPFLVRIARHELAEAAGMAFPNERALATAARKLMDRGARWLVVSDGAGRVRTWPGGESFTPPRVRALNPIGSGDAMMAGIAHRLQQGSDMTEAVLWGIACGTANAIREKAGTLRLADVQGLLAHLQRDRRSVKCET